MLRLKKSRSGFIVAGLFLILVIAAFAIQISAVISDPGNSELSGIFIIPLIFPWVFFLPDAVVYSPFWKWGVYPVTGMLALLNCFLLYCLFGGLRGNAKP